MTRERVRFKEGDTVAYFDNLYTCMTVKEIIYKKVDVPVKPKEDGSGFEKKTVSRLDGILCQWFDAEQKYHEIKFHSRSLVPWDVAKEGAIAVSKYLNKE